MAARGFLVCRAAGGAETAGVPPALAPGRRGPRAATLWVGPWSAARAAREAGRLDGLDAA